jgi:membrane protease YdiL (CAAX protease family)
MAVGPLALVLLALPSVVRGTARPWLLLLALVAVVDTAATMLPILDKQLQFPGVHWNWAGKALDIAAMLAIAIALIATRTLSARDIGLTLRQAPGTARLTLSVVLPYLIALAALSAFVFGTSKPPSAETIAFQATMPGLAEELAWRGLMLALFDKMFPSRGFSYGMIATSVVFGLIHGVQIGDDLSLHFALDSLAFAAGTGFFFAWLRSRTGSLVLPVVIHNATNVIMQTVPLMG